MFTYLFEEHGKTVHVMQSTSLWRAKEKLEEALGLSYTLTWDHIGAKVRVIDTKYLSVRINPDTAIKEITSNES